MTRDFLGYQHFLPSGLDLGVWSNFENANFPTVSARALIFQMNIFGENIFLLVDICPYALGLLWN